jgi:tRNA pseudouridine38-40 synthase
MKRIALGLEYDGSTFSGWQIQPDRPTVQGAVQAALSAIAGHGVEVVCAGRTDTGVHAIGQVVHFDVSADRPLSAWVRGANAHLPSGVAVLWSREVPPEFHARFCATARRYRYTLVNRAVRPALGAATLGWFHQPLDVGRMRVAAHHLLGTHDFSAFRSAECQARSPVKTMHVIEIHREGDMIAFVFEANAFLHHMVRNIVGCLIHVGKGAREAAWLAQLLAARDRTLAAPTFSPAGLCLEHVSYDARWGLPTADASSSTAEANP